MFKIIINGLSTGLILQLAIGPVFIFIANTVIQKSLTDGLYATAAVAVADYLYIILAIIGAGKLLEKQKYKKLFGITSSVILMVFGVVIILSSHPESSFSNTGHGGTAGAFISAFILTITNPLTILFWTGLFTAKTLELNLSRSELTVFGLSSGFSTILFLGSSATAISFFKNIIPLPVIKYLNISVGVILLIYGTSRFLKTEGKT